MHGTTQQETVPDLWLNQHVTPASLRRATALPYQDTTKKSAGIPLLAFLSIITVTLGLCRAPFLRLNPATTSCQCLQVCQPHQYQLFLLLIAGLSILLASYHDDNTNQSKATPMDCHPLFLVIFVAQSLTPQQSRIKRHATLCQMSPEFPCRKSVTSR